MAGGRKSKPAPPPPPARTLVLDNGAYTLKAGYADEAASDSSESTPGLPKLIPNCLVRDRQRRTYIGSEVAQRCRDFGEASFRRPVDRGYIVNWEAQRAIWAQELGDDGLQCDFGETRLMLTEQPNALPALQANCDQMVFEEFQFASYYRGTAAQFNAYLDLGSASSSSSPVPKPEPSADVTMTSAEDPTPASTAAPTTAVTTTTTTTATTSPTTTPTGAAELRLVVDAGYSFTTVTPVLRGRPVPRAIRRLDVGGKLLTNYLTKLLSVRHYDMRHDTHIVNEIKEKACYVSLDFAGDLDKCWRGPRAMVGEESADKRRRLELHRSGSAGIAKEYVLPDYQVRMQGIVRDFDPVAAAARARRGGGGGAAGLADAAASNEDVLVLRNERFAVPELLFHPADIGLDQPGLPDVVAQSVACLPVGLWPALLANIVVVGGSAELPGFVQRLQREVQARMPDDLPVVRVTRPADPITCTWRGAARFASLPENASVVNALAVTKQEYEEHGAGWVARKFAAGLAGDVD